MRDAEIGLEDFAGSRVSNASADYRLAFRELGLSIGLHAISRIQKTIEQHPENFSNLHDMHVTLSGLQRFHPSLEHIKEFRLAPSNQQSHNWTAHRDTSSMMLAASFEPDGYLIIR